MKYLASLVAKPLTKLTGNVPWKWENEQERAFNGLKLLLTTAPVLRMPNDFRKFRVEADASDGAVRAVLSQEHDGKMHPVAYFFKALSATERNYEIYNKELLAIMMALEEW